MKNLHRIMGAKFQHSKPALCPVCTHRNEHGEWEGYCTLRGKILSAPKIGTKRGRCKDFKGLQDTD